MKLMDILNDLIEEKQSIIIVSNSNNPEFIFVEIFKLKDHLINEFEFYKKEQISHTSWIDLANTSGQVDIDREIVVEFKCNDVGQEKLLINDIEVEF